MKRVDGLIARLAANQHGVVALWQLLRLGVTRREVERRVQSGVLHRLHQGVYAVGHPGVSREGEFMAAVLTGGPHAVLSHWSAAEHWRLLKTCRSLIAISVPSHRRASKLVRPHWVQFDKRDRTLRDRIPITTVPRTLLDLAATAPTKQLQRAVNEAERRGLLKEKAMRETLERHHRRPGTARLRSLIAAVDPQAHRSRSDLELDFLSFCRRYGIPIPVLNGQIGDYEVDFHWPGTKLIVELDTWDYHGTTGAFETDRERDTYLAGEGYIVIRVTARRLQTDPAGLAATIRRLLQT